MFCQQAEILYQSRCMSEKQNPNFQLDNSDLNFTMNFLVKDMQKQTKVSIWIKWRLVAINTPHSGVVSEVLSLNPAGAKS